MGQVGHALLTRSPLSRPEQAPADPVRLACVKHAASVHPEPESNPPQKTFMERHRIDDSQKNKKLNKPFSGKRRCPQKPRPVQPASRHPHEENARAVDGLAII